MRNMRKGLYLFVAILLMAISTTYAGNKKKAQFVRVSGPDLIQPNGKSCISRALI